MATTIFCQHWALSSPVPTTCKNPCTIYPTTPPEQRTEEQIKGCFWAATKKKKNDRGVKMWLCFSCRLIPPTSSRAATLARCFPEMRSWRGLCVGGGKGRISFIMASEQHLGQMRVTEVPLAGDSHIKKTWARLPQGHSTFVERKKQRPRDEEKTPLESAECLGVVVHGFSFLWLFQFSTSTLSTIVLV